MKNLRALASSATDYASPEIMRFEIKLPFEARLIPLVKMWILVHPAGFHESYPPRQVNNVYFDTFELDYLNAHIGGSLDRQKVRLRWYGKNVAEMHQPTLEIKHKSNQVNRKSSFRYLLNFSLKGMNWLEFLPTLLAQTAPEYQPYLTRSTPVLINSYQREYFVAMDGETRLTLDYGICDYLQKYSLTPNLEFSSPPTDTAILEIKRNLADEVGQAALSKILSDFPVRLSRYSKYISAVTGHSME